MDDQNMDDQNMDEQETKAKVAELFISDDATRRSIICGLIGHSHIVEECGVGSGLWMRCARCGKILPKLKAPTGLVFLNHDDCESCQRGLENLDWRDTWESPPLGQTDGRD